MLNSQVLASILLFLLAALSALVSQEPQKPDESRFTPVVVIPGGVLDEPMNFEVLRDGRAYVNERKGRLMLYDPKTNTTRKVDSLVVSHTYTSAAGKQTEAEEGFIGFTLDPDFEQNHYAYFIYAHPTIAKHVLSRMELRGDTLLKNTEKVILQWSVQRETCCHTGGGMTWDRQGNLYITVGNNTGNSQGSQTDESPGRTNWDDQRGSANTNDLRGKILRIHPEPDGSYAIPRGNLFPPGTPNTRPEIYTMGHRNAWRPSIDSRTGFLYWGEVGPDAAAATDNTVEGYDELNQARGPGYFGWPYFIGPSRAYPITDYNAGRVGPPKDPAHPVNNSVNNTGLKELPPAQPAYISYPYAVSEKFPEVGSGGRCAVGGPIYHQSDRPSAARPWPAYYEGKWLATDCSRGWIMAISMAADGDYQSMERFLPAFRTVIPLDMKFGADGDLYVLDYGSGSFNKAPDSKLIRIEYNAGNRAPRVEVSSNVTGGRLPLSVTLSSLGTTDPDSDALRYEWRVAPKAGGAVRTFDIANPTVTIDQPGEYTATLTVRDPAGATASKALRIVAGNEPPKVAIDLTAGNRSFFLPNRSISYTVRVTDAEDGTVDPERVAASIDYVPAGFDLASIRQGDDPVGASTRFAVARALIAKSDCRACHAATGQRTVGPTFQEIAGRYSGDAAALARLTAKVRSGGSGVWGDASMPAHPGLSVAEAQSVVRYILASNTTAIRGVPLSGSYTPDLPEGDNGQGSVVIRAVYTDRPRGTVPAQTAESMLVLRAPTLAAYTADVIEGAGVENGGGAGGGGIVLLAKPNSYIVFKGVDLTGIRQLQLVGNANARNGQVGGTIEIHLDTATGELAGQLDIPLAQPGAGGGGANQGAVGQGAQGGQGASAPAGAAGATGRGGGAARTVDLRSTAGSHDLYLVFKNDRARPVDPLFSLSRITFVGQ